MLAQTVNTCGAVLDNGLDDADTIDWKAIDDQAASDESRSPLFEYPDGPCGR